MAVQQSNPFAQKDPRVITVKPPVPPAARPVGEATLTGHANPAPCASLLASRLPS